MRTTAARAERPLEQGTIQNMNCRRFELPKRLFFCLVVPVSRYQFGLRWAALSVPDETTPLRYLTF